MCSLFLIGCNHSKNNESVNFPTDDNGYPIGNIAMINGKEISLDNFSLKSDYINELNIEFDKESVVEVILPRSTPINIWSIEEKENIDLISYEKKAIKY